MTAEPVPALLPPPSGSPKWRRRASLALAGLSAAEVITLTTEGEARRAAGA